MKEVLMSPVFWSGAANVLVILAVIFKKPAGLLNALARRQLFNVESKNQN